VIYFTDASTKFGYGQSDLDVLEGRPNGRLLKYDPSTKATSVLATDLFFPNGVALASDQTFLVFCETSKYILTIFTAKLDHLRQKMDRHYRSTLISKHDAFYRECDGAHTTLCFWPDSSSSCFLPIVEEYAVKNYGYEENGREKWRSSSTISLVIQTTYGQLREGRSGSAL
jgi:hypothetical protein